MKSTPSLRSVARNAPKFADVVRRQNVMVRQGDPRQGDPRNEDVVGAYPYAPSLQVRADDAGSFARVPVQLDQLKGRAKLPAYNSALLRLPAAQRPKHQLGNRHGREKLVRSSEGGCAERSISGRLPISSVNSSAGQPCWTASSTTRAGTAGFTGASAHGVCERSWMIRAT